MGLEVDLESGEGTGHQPAEKPSDQCLKVVIDEREEEKKGNVEVVAMTEKREKSRGGSNVGKQPPRHPRGRPSLVAADRRFIEQMVMLKRVKTERLKELSRLDDAASSSSKEISLLYLLVIIVLCLLLFSLSEIRT